MPRRPRPILALTLAAAAAVTASCFIGVRAVHLTRSATELGAYVGRGALFLESGRRGPSAVAGRPAWSVELEIVSTPPDRFLPVPRLATFTSGSSAIVPLWPVPCGLGLLWLVACRRAAARGEAGCPACGYDFSGAPPGPCPECGAARPAP